MSADFSGRSVAITGAGKGLGRAYALWFASKGARVVVNNRTHPNASSSAEAVVEEIRAAGGTAISDTHPVEDEAGMRRMVQSAIDTYGALDILICNAGVLMPTDLSDDSAEKIRYMMEINFYGTLNAMRAAFPHMRARGYGRIVVSTSASALFPGGGVGYSASKAALIGLVRSSSKKPARGNVHINLISPNAYTPMGERFLDPDLAQLLDPLKVAPIVGWLCSEACDRSGEIVCGGAGTVSHTAILQSAPIDLSPDEFPTWDLFGPVGGYREYDSAFAYTNELIARHRGPPRG